MSIEGFVAEARAYVAFIDGAAATPSTERMHAARARLLALYTAGLALTSIDAPDIKRPSRSSKRLDWSFERDMYWMVFDPQEKNEAPVAHREAAQWSWHFNFHVHWGRHAIDALRALHGLCA